jgi:hypothetical protein
MYCKICSSEVNKIEIEGKIYYRCNNCEFIFLDKKDTVSAEKEKKRYLKHENSLENKGYVKMLNDFIEKIPNKDRIITALDFGSGPNPVLAHLLKEKGINADIYDIYFAPPEDYKNKKYDLITATEVVEHLKEPLGILKELVKHLNKNGILAVMTSLHKNNEEEFKKWQYRMDETHISFYSEKTIKYLAEILELEVLMIEKNIIILKKK